LLDSSVVQRSQQWWLYLAGQPGGFGATDIFSASLATGAPLSAAGWKLTRGAAGELAATARRYATGWDPAKGNWVERIYYAGAADNLWGPYTIGYLEWDGGNWIDQPEPAFIANEDWEHGSVFEPNLIYQNGKWRMWYVAGANHEDYLVQGYAESDGGRTGWSEHVLFAPPEMKMFDFCIRQRGSRFDAIFARVLVGKGAPPPETGLWWCRAEHSSRTLSEWSAPIQIMTAEDRGWHSGPWKPSFQFDGQTQDRAIVFFDGLYRTSDPGPFPFAFTPGRFRVDLP
jgi:hypothetical protein